MEEICLIIIFVLSAVYAVYLTDVFNSFRKSWVFVGLVCFLTGVLVNYSVEFIHSYIPVIPKIERFDEPIILTFLMLITAIPVFFTGALYRSRIHHCYAIYEKHGDHLIIGRYDPEKWIETTTTTVDGVTKTEENTIYKINEGAIQSWWYMMEQAGAKIYKSRICYNIILYKVGDKVNIKHFREVKDGYE